MWKPLVICLRIRWFSKMAKSVIVLLALFVFTAQSAVVRNEEASLKRVPRCDQCEKHGPPPPPFGRGYHTHNWSGYSRDARGEGVFSGAAAATQGTDQSVGQAFSIAASEAATGSAGSGGQSATSGAATRYGGGGFGGGAGGRKNGAGGYGGGAGGYGGGTGGYGGNAGGYGGGASGLKSDAGGNGGSANGYNSAAGGYKGGASGYNSGAGGYGGGASGHGGGSGIHGDEGYGGNSAQNSYKSNQEESQFPHKNNESNQGRGVTEEQFDGNQQIESHGFNPASQAQSNANSGAGSHGTQFGKYSSGTQSGYGQSKEQEKVDHASALGHDTQQVQSGQGAGDSGANAGAAAGSVGTGLEYGGQETAQSTLGGALNLASQGLQTAQQAGCSTCGKSSYALSNAKSNSGSAVAVSIGG